MSAEYVLSVIIVNFNGKKYLAESLDSIAKQLNESVEIIVIDGGSNDGSVDVIQRYSDSINAFLSEPDKGQSDAINKGVAMSNGRFFMWLNSDDIIMNGSIEIILKTIKNNPTGSWFSGNTVFINSKGIIRKCSKGPNWNSFLFRNNYISVFGPTSIVCRDVYNATGKFDINLSYCMDTDYWCRMFNAGYKFIKINYYLFGFRVHHDSKTSHAFFRSPNDSFLDEQKKILLQNGIRILNCKVFLMRFWKLISFSYLTSKIDSFVFGGKHYSLIYRS